MRIILRFSAFLASLACVTQHMYGQTEYYRPSAAVMNISGMWMAKTSLSNVSNGYYQLPQGEIRFQVPLIQKRQEHNTTAIPSYFRLNVQAGSSFVEGSWSAFRKNHYFVQPFLGLTSMWYKGNRNLFAGSAAVFISEDLLTISSPKPRIRGYVLYRRLARPKGSFSFIAGAAYSFLLGKGQVLPVLGVRGALSEKLFYSVVFPYHVQLLYRPQPYLRFQTSIKPNGNIFRFGNQDSIPTVPPVAVMLTRGLQAGVGAGFSFSSQFRMALESGVVMGRRVGLIEDARKAKIDFYRQDFPKMTYFARISMDIYLQDNRNSPEDVLWELRN